MPMAGKNLIDSIYQDLRTKILSEIIHPGQKISETALAGEYSCSRTPVRETLKRLEDDGLVIIKPKSGTYVKNETSQDFVDLMQVRSSLERLAFHLALGRAGAQDINRLEKKVAELDSLVAEDPIDMMKFARIHYDFHFSLIELSGNKLLMRQFERLNHKSSHMFYQMMDKDRADDTQAEHREIITLLKNKEESGAEYVENHLSRKINRFLRIDENKALI